MSLTTPDKIRNFQRKLYCKAKAEPTFRFYLLYDKICREDILVHAYRLAGMGNGALAIGPGSAAFCRQSLNPGGILGGSSWPALALQSGKEASRARNTLHTSLPEN
jgi:hypothetical protein